MRDRRLYTFWGGIACLLAVWTILFAAYVIAFHPATHTPGWIIYALIGLSALLVGTSRAPVRRQWAAALALVSVVIAFSLVRDKDLDASDVWRLDAANRIATTLNAVGNEIAQLHRLSTTIGERTAEFLANSEQQDLFLTFALLDSLAVDASSGGALPPGTEIGIQLFVADGASVAWAGWAQSVDAQGLRFIGRGKELLYSRKVSLYRILTHVIPIRDASGGHSHTVFIDMPLEVNFRVNNRFLKSTSIVDNIAHDSVADVKFDYFPATTRLPDRLNRFKETQIRNFERRQRMIEEASGRRVHSADSTLLFFPFPEHIEPASLIAGNELSGMHGRVIVRAPQGNPVLGIAATSQPYRHYESRKEARRLLIARLLIVFVLVTIFVLVASALRAHGTVRAAWTGAALFVGFLAVLRYAVLSFRTSSGTEGMKIFDPTVFATPLFGGLMRSAGDMLITAAFFVVALYGVVKVARSHGRVQPDDSGKTRAWLSIPKGIAIALVLAGVVDLTRGFVATVVINANPRLVGETMAIAAPEVLVLHLGIFLIVTGILLCSVYVAWGLLRTSGTADTNRTALVALGIVAAIAITSGRWELVAVAIPLLLLIVYAPRFVQREDLVSIVIVAFCLAIVSSGTTYVFLSRDYDGLRKSFVQEKAHEMLDPSDNWKVVILEDVLDEFSGRGEIQQAIRSPRSLDVQRLAFDLWAESPLSYLGYSCAIHIVTGEDSVVSNFSVDMPYRARIADGTERTETPTGDVWAVLDLTRGTPQGVVRFYRGILNLRDERIDPDGQVVQHLLGKVIVDLPFHFEGLRLASRTGPRTPEVLRNVQAGGVSPRVEEPEALLLARLDGDQVYESSSAFVPLGMRIPQALLRRALDEKWPLLSADEKSFRFVLYRTGESDDYLLAGFVVPSPMRHLLRWSTLLSLYLVFAFAIIVAIMLLGTIPVLKDLLPTLTPGKRLGFQQKLLASFLVVALVPAIMLGMFSANFIRDRFLKESRQEALLKAISARKAFVNVLRGELQFLLDPVDVTGLFDPGNSIVKAVGGKRVVRLFLDLTEGGTDADIAGLGIDVSGAIANASQEDLFVLREAETTYIGVVSAPVRVMRDDWSRSFYIYYGRLIDAKLLGEIADQVGSDVNVYDSGELVASSREGLLAGGFISSIMNADAFVNVSMMGADYELATERAGHYNYQVAYLPVVRWDSDAGRKNITNRGNFAALSVPLLFRPESYYVEVQKATSVVLGIFALLFAATLGIGLFLARGIFEPLRGLLAGTRRISEGDLDVRLPDHRSDEIGTLMRSFNEMAKQVQKSQKALEERSKLEAWVEMARQVAHEIKNPLTPIRISTQFMRRAYRQKPEQFEQVFEEGTTTILHQVDVLKRIASEFSSYGRMQNLDINRHSLDPMIRKIVGSYERNDTGVAITYENGYPDAEVLVDPEAVRKICANLIENSLEAMPRGGELRIAFSEGSRNGDNVMHVTFRDTGTGLSAEVAQKLFEPYFSTKTTGTGLGLAICRTLSREMDGDIEVANVKDGNGVEAILTLKAAL